MNFKYIFVGLFAGFCTGLFGAGGGMIIVPALIYYLKMDDYKAHGTSLFIVLPTTILSLLLYAKSQYINLNIGISVALGGVIGGYIGAKFLKSIPIKWLRISFGAFMIFSAIRMVF